jgi:hypothetical protein
MGAFVAILVTVPNEQPKDDVSYDDQQRQKVVRVHSMEFTPLK